MAAMMAMAPRRSRSATPTLASRPDRRQPRASVPTSPPRKPIRATLSWSYAPSAVKEATGSATWSSKGPTWAASSSSRSVRVAATIRPVSASTPRWSFLPDRRFLAPCVSSSHAPAPQSFSPVLSTSRCMGPVSRPAPLSAPSPRGFGRGPSSVSARRHRVVWSGTARSSPSRPMTEPISPSVCRYASRNTALNVSAVRIARSEYAGCPPRLVRRSASHASTASSENQTVKLPRRRRLSSYSRQFVTLRFCSGMWQRRAWFSLKGKAGIPGQTEGCPATSIGPRVPPVGSLQQRAVCYLGLFDQAHQLDLAHVDRTDDRDLAILKHSLDGGDAALHLRQLQNGLRI